MFVKPFWNTSCSNLTEKIWLPSTISLHDHKSLSSWFHSTSLQNVDNKHLLQYQCDVRPQQTMFRCRKIRVIVSSQDKLIFQRWFGDARYTYNKCLSLIKAKQEKINFYHLRNKYVLNKNISQEERFLLQTPKDVRAGAVQQLVEAYETNFKRRKTDLNHCFDIQFKSKKRCLQEQIKVPASAFKFVEDTTNNTKRNGHKVYVRYTSAPLFSKHMKDSLPRVINHECNLIKDAMGRFYICIPSKIERPAEVINENQVDLTLTRVTALDPGIRTFITSFSNDEIKMYGNRCTSTLIQLCRYKDRMISFASTCTSKRKRHNLRKVQRRIQLKIKHLVDDMHNKIISDLLRNHDVILIPTFNVKDMVKRTKRKLRKCQVRAMLALAHYRFRQKLILKSTTMRNKRVLECTEEYTSKTCTRCGVIKRNLGGNEIYSCEHCDLLTLRDINGARNILIKYIERHLSCFKVENTVFM